ERPARPLWFSRCLNHDPGRLAPWSSPSGPRSPPLSAFARARAMPFDSAARPAKGGTGGLELVRDGEAEAGRRTDNRERDERQQQRVLRRDRTALVLEVRAEPEPEHLDLRRNAEQHLRNHPPPRLQQAIASRRSARE